MLVQPRRPSRDAGDFVLTVQEVATGLTSPTYVTSPPGDSRLFVVEQLGRIRIIENGQLLPTPFLDIASRISSGGERGLLSVAFHPSYKTNGFFYVYFTAANGDIRVERYSVSANANIANAASSKLIITAPHSSAPNHNGGLAMFGPDGKLYLGLGDGGGGGDPFGNGQNKTTLLGALLRIDVDNGDPYSIPAGNPYIGVSGARPELWAIGLRNPWRYSFDKQSGLLYIADVGQDRLEEVNVVPATQAGINFGWNIMEGMSCYNATTCDKTGLQLPVIDYSHSNGACSITGGFVYRGSAMPEVAGQYFYSDYCAGFLKSFRFSNGAATDAHDWNVGSIGSITSFGEDASGELYMTSSNGKVYKLTKGASL
jgi:glucose/arabinose dehydrogenase